MHFSGLLKQIVQGKDIPSSKPKKWGMIVDLSKCTGCEICTEACNVFHFVPRGQKWIELLEMEDSLGKEYLLPRLCNHCEEPPCEKVCPVGATFRTEEGNVLIDHRLCIGCRFCMAACPYNARFFNWEKPAADRNGVDKLPPEYTPELPLHHKKGTVEKCMFCAHHSEEGVLPVCVQSCPTGVIYFGDLNEDTVSNGRENLRVSEVVKQGFGFRLLEDLGTHPRVYYLPPIR
jgi:molybdopterin-containing oxidoreductase family iron-sulfur binding subunit